VGRLLDHEQSSVAELGVELARRLVVSGVATVAQTRPGARP
jgi:hypothetical protein